ncbi:hypothetical protein BSL78_05899 [Apostichopus japonicus]|uniref:Uncharacterized protein n=1 Tax=Stichopus japonicus TaxID=307972 RepID=A0A2G8LAL8_STIJA|nr:hypothetical protein BSL78_05899 [Apostichopus japonicus]
MALRSDQFRGELSELDDAGTYFDAKPTKVTETGHFHYMCTRNNNFSNRSQKGRIVCTNEVVMYQAIGWTGGTISSENSEVVFEQGTLSQLYDIRLEEWENGRGKRRSWRSEERRRSPATSTSVNSSCCTPPRRSPPTTPPSPCPSDTRAIRATSRSTTASRRRSPPGPRWTIRWRAAWSGWTCHREGRTWCGVITPSGRSWVSSSPPWQSS